MMSHYTIRFLAAGLGVTDSLAVGLAAFGAAQTTPAPAPSFTSAQVTLGQRVYTQNCQGCHGNKLQGVRAPALVGEKFLQKWADGKRPAADLHGYIAKNMPRNKPGSLSAAQALNVTALVLSRNGYKVGTRTLTATTLKRPLSPPSK